MTTYDYTSSTLVKSEIRATQDFSASTVPTLSELSTMINETSEYINQIGGRVYGSTSYTETIDYNGEEYITLKNAPVISVTSLLYSTSELGTDTYSLSDTKTEGTHYSVYEDTGEILLLFDQWSPKVGRKRMQVNYTAGYATVPLTIQMLATKLVAKRVIDTLLSKDINEKQSGKSVSVGSISIVKPANFGVSQYEKLKMDIDELENKIISGTTAYRIGGHRF